MDNLAEVLLSFDMENTRVYSGRGKHGGRCVSIVCENPRQTVVEIAKHIVETVTDQRLVLELLDDLSESGEDSSGVDLVMYFPQVDADLLGEDFEEDESYDDELYEVGMSKLDFGATG